MDLVNLDTICVPCEDIVVREIEGEIIIVPLTSDIGDMEDELFSLNETGKDIWNRLNGFRSLGDIAIELSIEYDAPANDIELDVVGLVNELVQRKMVLIK